MDKDKKDAGPGAVAFKGMPIAPDFPDDVDEMSSEDWTEAEAWLAKRRAWLAAKDAEAKPNS